MDSKLEYTISMFKYYCIVTITSIVALSEHIIFNNMFLS